jgi:YD repeat-containing protein
MLERITYPTGGYTSFEWEPHDVINYDPPVVTYQTRNIGSTASYPTNTTFKRDSSVDYYIDPAASPNGICATFSGRLNIPANAINDAAKIDHAAGSITVYRRAGRVAIATFVFPYNENNQYNQESRLNLEAGQHYFVMTEVRDNGFSVVGNLSGKVGTTTAVTPNKIVGGCRLKRMTFWEPVAGKSIVKSYTYRLPGDTAHSSGRLYRMPMYNRQVVKFVQTGTGCAYAMYTGVRLSSNSMISLGAGTHIGYTYVKEQMGEDAENGYILYNYQNSISFQGEFNPGWRNGYLRSKTIYNSRTQPVSKERNVYRLDSRGFTSFSCSTVDYYVKHPCAPTGNFESDKPVFAGGKNWLYPSEWFHLDSTVTEVYDMEVPSSVLTTSKAFAYDNVLHLQASKIITKTSDGTELSTTMRYPLDYTLPAGTLTPEAQAIKNMQAANMHPLIESYEQRKLASQVLQTREATYMAYKSLTTASGPVVLFDKQYNAETDMLSGAFVPSAVSDNGITKSAAYVLKATAHQYDAAYNIIEAEKQGSDLNAYIWDYNRNYMVAQFRNARQVDVAYTGFEADGKGNWTFAGAPVADATTITGKNCYNLAAGVITRTGLTAAKNYTVSYWTKNATPYSISGTVAGYPLKGETTNGWTCYEHKISGQPAVTISGTGFIDELRLYPADGTAITYTYDPLVGMTSICDEGNKTSYYGYDSDGRLVTIKDQQGKILKQMEYRYQGAVAR